MSQPQICTLWDKLDQKLKNIAFSYFMIIFHNLNLKIETGWALRVDKPILETTNVTDVYMYVCFRFPDIKYLFGT